MEKLSETRLSKILPENLLRDEQIKTCAAALDKMLSDLTEDVKQVIHLPRLDELSGQILDLLAWQVHTDFYEPLFLNDETKRNLIRQSIEWHRQLGTRAALEKVNAAFGREIKISEWYEYGGEPYWFRLKTKPFFKKKDQDAWLRQLNHVKNVRSWVEIIFSTQIETPLYVGIGRWKHGRKRRRMSSIYEVGRVTTAIQDDARTLEISATQVVIRYGDEEEIIPLGSLFGDQLRMRFSFPNNDRLLILNNPREDLTAAEVQEVADYATKNKIFLDGEGQATEPELKRVTLLTTTTQILF